MAAKGIGLQVANVRLEIGLHTVHSDPLKLGRGIGAFGFELHPVLQKAGRRAGNPLTALCQWCGPRAPGVVWFLAIASPGLYGDLCVLNWELLILMHYYSNYFLKFLFVISEEIRKIRCAQMERRLQR